jgi:hypothetical protein
VFTPSGRIEAEHVAELIELFDRDYQNIILDMEEVRLADRGNAANVIKRSRWTWCSFSRRMRLMHIMHEPHAISSSSLDVYVSSRERGI